MKRIILSLTTLLSVIFSAAQTTQSYKWGDQGNGTYMNPVLNADYSDPDVIRVGQKYYMVASDFHFLGMQLLVSDDLVNWTVLTQLYSRFDLPGWDDNRHYSGGSWAPSIRYHDGRFWVYFCTPDEGLFMTSAKHPEGPWEPLCQVKNIAKWEDPCPVWDDKGNAYLGRSAHGAGPIILHRMSNDGRQLLDDGVTIYTGPVAEGTKFLHKDGWYYLIIPEGGVGEGWQTVLRSKNLYGPYERKVVLEQGPTAINGPHQGALVDTPDGEWWFFHFQERSPMGRVVHLQPVHWEDGWPLMGVDMDGNGVGNPVTSWQVPKMYKTLKPHVPQTSDNFNSTTLSPQWQFCHNPHNDYWSLTDRSGSLTIMAQRSSNLMMAHNILTQKIMGWKGLISVMIDVSELKDAYAGLTSMGQSFYAIGVTNRKGRLCLYQDNGFRMSYFEDIPINADSVCLGLEYDALTNKFQFMAGTDRDSLKPIGKEFRQSNGFWKGTRVGLFCYNVNADGGKAHFDDFVYPIQR